MMHLDEALVQFQSGMSAPRPTMTPAGVPYSTHHPYPTPGAPHPYPTPHAYPTYIGRPVHPVTPQHEPYLAGRQVAVKRDLSKDFKSGNAVWPTNPLVT